MGRIAIEMPKLGYDMETGKVAGWLKRVGDTITRGDVIAEIETDKATVEVPATATGKIIDLIGRFDVEMQPHARRALALLREHDLHVPAPDERESRYVRVARLQEPLLPVGPRPTELEPEHVHVVVDAPRGGVDP